MAVVPFTAIAAEDGHRGGHGEKGGGDWLYSRIVPLRFLARGPTRIMWTFNKRAI